MPRLRPGFHLYSSTGNRWLLYGPGDRFLELQLEDGLGGRLVAALYEGDAAAAAEPAVAEALEQFAAYGLLESEERAETPPESLSERRVVITGDGPLLEPVRAVLEQAGLGPVAECPPGAELPEGAHLVVACAGWLPDRRWQRLDEECRRRDLPWQRCHFEGASALVGPPVVPGRTPDYRDARARRLSISHHPEELTAYWRSLEAGGPVAPWPRLDAGTLAALAGMVVRGALGVLGGKRGEAEPVGWEVEVDLRDLSWRRHPVLPVPRGLATEKAS